jgi:hypothetical protein
MGGRALSHLLEFTAAILASRCDSPATSGTCRALDCFSTKPWMKGSVEA